MNKYWLLISGFSILLLSTCGKHDKDSNQLGSIISSDAYALIVPDSADKSGATPLYKMTESENIEVVKFIAKDGSDMGAHFVPEGIYDLGNDYSLLNVSLNIPMQKVYDSYIVRNVDGVVYQLSPEFHPMKLEQGTWTNDFAVKSIKKSTDVIFYCLGNNQLHKINLSGNFRFTFKSIDVSNITFSNFDVDYQGNVMLGNTFIVSADTMLTTSAYEQGKTSIVKAMDYGFNLVKLQEGSIKISHLYLQDNQLKEDSLTTLVQENSGWQFLGGLSFPANHLTLAIFDKGILNITPSKISVTPLSTFNMKSISLTDQSLTYYYIVGTNMSDKKVFLQVDPTNASPTYSQLVAPNILDIKKIHVSGSNTVTVMAVRLSDNKLLYRRFRTGTLKDVLNYQGFNTRQVYTIK
jgi:hypothetical protein